MSTLLRYANATSPLGGEVAIAQRRAPGIYWTKGNLRYRSECKGRSDEPGAFKRAAQAAGYRFEAEFVFPPAIPRPDREHIRLAGRHLSDIEGQNLLCVILGRSLRRAG